MDEPERLKKLKRRAFFSLVFIPLVTTTGWDVQEISKGLYHYDPTPIPLLAVLGVIGIMAAYNCWIVLTSGLDFRRFWGAGTACLICILLEEFILAFANHLFLSWLRLE